MKSILTILIFVFATHLFSQNVGINSTGAAPNTSAMLDIVSTSSGLLVPRMTSAQKTAIAAPATGLLVYQTDAGSQGIGFYFYNGAAWVPFSTNNGGWGLLGNTGTIGTTNYIGTTDAQVFRIFTNNAEVVRFATNGRIGVATGATAPNGMIDVRGNYAAGTGNDGVIAAINSNASGIAVNGAGQNTTNNGLPTGSGGAFNGVSTGATAFYTTGGAGTSFYGADAFGASWSFGQWTGAAYRKVTGNGTVSTIAKGLNNERLIMNCPESPENLYMDYGHGKLINGIAKIIIDPILSKNIIVDAEHPLKVFVQLEGDCNGVFVTNKTSSGFEVKELQNGKSNVDFTYSIVATHGDETYISPDGHVRIAKYDLRWEKAADVPKTINPIIPVFSEK